MTQGTLNWTPVMDPQRGKEEDLAFIEDSPVIQCHNDPLRQVLISSV